MTLRQKIEQEIREHGPIPFSRYMARCLYDPEIGYYSRTAEQFGKAGDFYTSSDVHAVYGRLLARQFEEMWRALGQPDAIEILELGPGRGLFAQDVLDWSEKKFPEFFRALHYKLVETSPSLREKLQQSLRRHFESGKASLDEMAIFGPDNSLIGTSQTSPEPAAERRKNTAHGASRGLAAEPELAPEGRKSSRSAWSVEARPPVLLFANEFFDALPVEIISTAGLLHVDAKDGKFVETFLPCTPEVHEYLDRYSVRPEPGGRVEAPLEAFRAMNRICAPLRRGFMVLVDYGYTRQEQLGGRHRGTLMTYRQHSASANPYEAPGEQDITAHVNFTALAEAAGQNRMQVQPLLTQSQFLMGIGEKNQFADAWEDCRLPQERAKVALQLKHLVTPAGMGESFHVLVASKEVDADKVATLGGLSFGKSRLGDSQAPRIRAD